MRIYLQPIQMGVLIFFAAAFLMILPYFIIQYRKHGSVSTWRLLVTFSFVLYIICAYAMTIFPLPSREEVEHMTGPVQNLKPFEFVRYFKEYSPFVLSDKSTWLPALKHWTFIQPFFNFLLTLPFGVYMSYLFKKKFSTTLIYSFPLTLSFELIQRSALFGLYPRPYRLFDVDDLMINTAGALFCYGLGQILKNFLPDLDKVQVKSSQVSFTRRLTGIIVDLILLSIITPFVSKIYIGPLIVFLIPSIIFKRTLGQFLVKIYIEPENRLLITLRIILISINFIPFIIAGRLLDLTGTAPENELSGIYIGLMICAALILIEGLDFLLAIFNKTKRLWYERLSHTRLVGK